MDVNPLNDSSTGSVELTLRCVRDLSQTSLLTRCGNLGRGCAGSTGRRVNLIGVMQLDDLRRLVEPCGLLDEVHHEDSADRKVRGHQAADVRMVGELVAQNLIPLIVKPSRADDSVNVMGNRP